MSMLRTVIICLIAATAVPMYAAQLRVKGLVTELASGKPMADVLIRVYKDGQVQHLSYTGAAGRYAVLLDNNASYIIRFSRIGHTTKCFAVDTHGPEWENDKRVMELEVEMTMFATVQDLDLSFFDLPLGMARFTPMTGVLAWNSDYEARVKPEVDRLMHELAARREQLAALEAQRREEQLSVQ